MASNYGKHSDPSNKRRSTAGEKMTMHGKNTKYLKSTKHNPNNQRTISRVHESTTTALQGYIEDQNNNKT